MSLLRVENMSMQVTPGSTRLVDSLSFNVNPGEIFALIGPSGSGKTTTLRLVAGFEQPFQGRIVLDGRVLEDLGIHVTPERRGIGFVFQDLALFPHLTVADNVAFGLHKLPKNRRRARVLEMLEVVCMTDKIDRRPHELSGGEQQRVALARAMAPSPRLLLLDEPFANLDPSLRDDLRVRIHAIIKDEKITAVLVTHDHAEAMSIADRIGVMRGGRLEQVGVPREIYQQPQSKFVSDFIGGRSPLRSLDDGDDADGDANVFPRSS
jgi:iron(III) transport system ATP-binding protein